MSTSSTTAASPRWSAPDPLHIHLLTEHLLIRPLQVSDADVIYDTVVDNRDHLLRFMPWAKNYTHRAFAAKYCAEQELAVSDPANFTMVTLGIFDRYTARFLGSTGVHAIHPPAARGECGYWIRKDATGHGYAREAAARVFSWAFAPQDAGGLGLQRMVVVCAGSNAASRRTVEKLGMTLEATRRRHLYTDGVGLDDELLWGMLVEEWDCEGHRPR